jgi:hypothetical protein
MRVINVITSKIIATTSRMIVIKRAVTPNEVLVLPSVYIANRSMGILITFKKRMKKINDANICRELNSIPK